MCSALLMAQMALKCADLSHMVDATSYHLKWVADLEQECFLQGDAEKRLGLPVTPLFDRTKPGLTKSQVAFMEIVALPLFQALSEAFPDTQYLCDGVSDRARFRHPTNSFTDASTRACFVKRNSGSCFKP
jgi:hypothetical protein